MRRASRQTRTFILVAGIALVASAAPAVAQAVAEGAPTMPRPRFADSPPVLINMILAFALGLAVAAPNFIPSKRGHQD